MNGKVTLTGIKPTGRPHLGNYIGAIKPAIKNNSINSLFFIADYHALTIIRNPKHLKELTYEVAATWLAMGLDPKKVIFYKQSDIPEIFEINWILSCYTSKGLMNRAHAYKDAVSKNISKGLDDNDTGVNMGLYTYPILMASDILLFNTDLVPVGKDQIQHVEIARDIAEKFNNNYGETFILPTSQIKYNSQTILGLDGRKMSKSYQNTIPLFVKSNELKKLIFKIKTDSSPPNKPKNPDNSILFQIYSEFASSHEVDILRGKMKEGIGWGELKELVFKTVDTYLEIPRQRYNHYINNKTEIENLLMEGAKKAQEIAKPNLERIKSKIGI